MYRLLLDRQQEEKDFREKVRSQVQVEMPGTTGSVQEAMGKPLWFKDGNHIWMDHWDNKSDEKEGWGQVMMDFNHWILQWTLNTIFLSPSSSLHWNILVEYYMYTV